jgi:hypothetical protein
MEEEEGEVEDSLQTSYLLSLKNRLLDQAGLLRALEDKEASIQRVQRELEAAKTLYTQSLAVSEEGPLAIARANHELQQVQMQLEAVKAHNEQLLVKVSNRPDEKVEREIASIKEEIRGKDEVNTNLKWKLDIAQAEEAEIMFQWESVQRAAFETAKPLRRKLEKAKRLQLHLKAVLLEASKQLRVVERDLGKCRRKRSLQA